MSETSFIMNDTLDDFLLGDVGSQNTGTSEEIYFEDSMFLNNLSVGLDETKDTTCYNPRQISEESIEESLPSVSEKCSNYGSQLLTSPGKFDVENVLEPFTVSSQIGSTPFSQTDQNMDSSPAKPISSSNATDNLQLSSWGLPEAVLDKYHSKHIVEMFPWQVECLNNSRILNDLCHLVYSAPTSAGKTLVAEILALKTIFERKKKVIFILPFVSIVREKMYYFQDILGSSGVRTEGFMGSYNPPGGFSSIQFAICTIEKANSLLNRLLEENKVSEIGAVLIDEMHLLGDPHRGYILELLLTKLRYVTLKDPSIQIQIVGMSATLPNLNQLAQWLDAELYCTSYRPVPLHEWASINGNIHDKNMQFVRELNPLPDVEVDTDNVLQLCLETVTQSCSVLIFCPTKNWCENLAQQISAAFFKIGKTQSALGQQLRSQIKSDLIIEALEQLKFCPAKLDPVLKRTVSFGVAFHHAGLTMDERDIIEGAFRNGTVKVLVATSTLSSGVNLPARRVIIRSPNFCGKPLDILTYRQMVGRAGRLGKDTVGESIIVCQKTESSTVQKLMTSDIPAIESCFEGAGKLKRAILEIIASGMAATPDDVKLFTNCTLLAITGPKENGLKDIIQDTIDFLLKYEFIRLQESGAVAKYTATSLGKACLSSSVPPEEALALFAELEKARKCFVLDTELHLVYLVTPYSACYTWNQIDWMFYLELWSKLPTAMKRVGDLVGVKEFYIINAARGKMDTNTSKGYEKLMIHKRFFVALALQDLVNEMPLSEVSSKYNCNRGVLQSLQQSASTFAGMVTSFSRQLGWSSVELLLSQFQDRMQFGVSRDLLDLMRLPSLNGKLARTLYNAGIETVIQLANQEAHCVEDVLCRAAPFQRAEDKDVRLKTIWISGKEGLTEGQAAELLVREAREYLVCEMGLKQAKWETDSEAKPSVSNGSTSLSFHTPESPCKVDTKAEEKHISSALARLSISNLDANTSKNEGNDARSPLELNISSSSSQSSDKSLSDDEIPHKDETINRSNSSLDLFESDRSLESVESNEKNIDLAVPSKRLRSLNASSEDSFLEATPRKKTKLSYGLITPSHCTIRRSLNLTLEEEACNVPKIDIVDVCSNSLLLDTFCREAEEREVFAFCVSCSKNDVSHPTIGLNASEKKSRTDLVKNMTYKDKKLDSFTFCWGGTATYHISIKDESHYQKIIRVLRKTFADKRRTVLMFGAKEQLKVLIQRLSIQLNCKIEDPKVLDWLLDPDGKEKSLQAMINYYCNHLREISQLCGSTSSIGSLGMDSDSPIEAKLRSSVETLLVWRLTSVLKEKLNTQCPKLQLKLNSSCFVSTCDVEMRILSILATAEAYGMRISKATMLNLADLLKQRQQSIERKAFSLAGRRFNFASPKDVAKVTGLFKGTRGSTNKQTLQKTDHPISILVSLWRKINFTLTKMVYPFIKSCENNRVHGCYETHSATGRITMREPNIQMVTKDFSFTDPFSDTHVSISCRKAFTVEEHFVLISADYCQLELRILTYLSKDKVLVDIMKTPGDIFKSIAAKWNDVNETMVDDNMRQNTKQLIYGIIYGMGAKRLAEQLNVTEEDASDFMESFRNTYLGVKHFIKRTIECCRINGFVETVANRRRYLPSINHDDCSMKSQAERQAVNTVIQGSAADIVKRAMIAIEERINLVFEKARLRPKLILHLHDELIYEVPEKYADKTIRIVRSGMENSASFLGYFPVKIKTGKSWGELKEHRAK